MTKAQLKSGEGKYVAGASISNTGTCCYAKGYQMHVKATPVTPLLAKRPISRYTRNKMAQKSAWRRRGVYHLHMRAIEVCGRVWLACRPPHLTPHVDSARMVTVLV